MVPEVNHRSYDFSYYLDKHFRCLIGAFYFLSAVYGSRRVYISVYYYWTLVNIAQLPLPLENEARVPGYDTAYEAESLNFNAWIFFAT